MDTSVEKLLFAAVSGLDDDKERRAFLDYACRDDAGLRKRLDELLEVQAAAETFFEFQPEVHAPGGPAGEIEDEGIGARIGRYTLITRIGTGGCGAVYLAEQEEPVRRKVALKIVKLGMDTEAVIGRFRLERQALAQMDHPNIARVLDAGATPSGRPYFVMELVEGEKITDFCDANHLGIRQRLDLFVQVCRAIQHAHQKGVIHLDIKPSNVLVRLHDGSPAPKVIDFGIAKATAEDIGVEATSTRRVQFIGTPAYMSPEQARGGADIDTRSDIYSLGVLLYELVSGRMPFGRKGLADKPTDEIRRIIEAEEPKPPSVALQMATGAEGADIAAKRETSSHQLVLLLGTDLDWIVMRAMEKERSRRYDTATGLAMDVVRYLNYEPVLAHPRSRAYVMGKSMCRNKRVFVAAGIAFFGLFAGFGTSTWMFFQEREALREQARLREKAELREVIANAAVKIEYGDLAGADELLGKVPIDQTPSSLEAAQAFGAVANWHVAAGRLDEAAARFTSVVRAISSVDSSDLPTVSFNLLPVAATVAYSDGPKPYEEIRQMAIRRFGSTSNLIVAEQTLKACLLLPPDGRTLQALAPLAEKLEGGLAAGNGEIGNDPHATGWTLFSLALMGYRADEYGKATEWVERCLAAPNENPARDATALIVLAMIQERSGQPAKAHASLEQARSAVHDVFLSKEWMTAKWPVFWFDWINAAVLLNEAERLPAKA